MLRLFSLLSSEEDGNCNNIKIDLKYNEIWNEVEEARMQVFKLVDLYLLGCN